MHTVLVLPAASYSFQLLLDVVHSKRVVQRAHSQPLIECEIEPSTDIAAFSGITRRTVAALALRDTGSGSSGAPVAARSFGVVVVDIDAGAGAGNIHSTRIRL